MEREDQLKRIARHADTGPRPMDLDEKLRSFLPSRAVTDAFGLWVLAGMAVFSLFVVGVIFGLGFSVPLNLTRFAEAVLVAGISTGICVIVVRFLLMLVEPRPPGPPVEDEDVERRRVSARDALATAAAARAGGGELSVREQKGGEVSAAEAANGEIALVPESTKKREE